VLALMAAQHRDHDIGGTQGRDLLRQVLVIGGRGDEHGVASLCHMDTCWMDLKGVFGPRPSLASSPDLESTYHSMTSEHPMLPMKVKD
jgi:hypothetical protein